MDHPHAPANGNALGTEMGLHVEFLASGRGGPDRVDTATLLFSCQHPDCETKLELIVDLAATFAIFQAHQITHAPIKDAAALAELFGPDGQPLSAKRPGILDT